MDLRLDVAYEGQEVIQNLFPVLLEIVLQGGYLLLGLLLHFGAAAAVGSQRRSFLGLEVLLPLQAVLFDFCLGLFFGLLQSPILSCHQRKKRHQEVVKTQAETKAVSSNSKHWKEKKKPFKDTVPRDMAGKEKDLSQWLIRVSASIQAELKGRRSKDRLA